MLIKKPNSVDCQSDERLREEARTSPAESDERLREEAKREDEVNGEPQESES
jgi:hypothetical protein